MSKIKNDKDNIESMGNGDCSILFVLETEMEVYGGTERWLSDFIKVNVKDLHDIGIAKFKSESKQSEILFNNLFGTSNIKLINFRNVGITNLARKLKRIFGDGIYRYFFYQVLFILGNLGTRKFIRKYDVAYLTSYNIIIPFRILNPRIKIVYGTHNNDFSSLKNKKFSPGYLHAKISLALTDAVHFVSESSIGNLNFKSKIVSVNNGIDTKNFHPSSLVKDRSRINVLYVGRLEEGKGIKIVIEAIKKLPITGYFLTICGDGTLRDYVLSNKPTNSQYLPNLTNDMLSEIYRANDVFIFPSRNETFGLVVLEALASGLYCVVSETLRPKFEEFATLGLLEYCKRDAQSFADILLNVSSKLPSNERKRKVFSIIESQYSIYNLYARISDKIHEVCEE